MSDAGISVLTYSHCMRSAPGSQKRLRVNPYLDHDEAWNTGGLLSVSNQTVRVYLPFPHYDRLNKLRKGIVSDQRSEDLIQSLACLKPVVRIYVSCFGITSLELDGLRADGSESRPHHQRGIP